MFGSSLNTLVSHPALYGWNWNYEMLGNVSGRADIPLRQTAQLLDRDRYVASWSRVSFDDLRINGQVLPVLGTTPKRHRRAPLTLWTRVASAQSGRRGPLHAGRIHRHIGDTVTFDNTMTKPTRLVIVGATTLPAIGDGQSLHLETLDRSASRLGSDRRLLPNHQG